jgi:hypothetical protein
MNLVILARMKQAPNHFSGGIEPAKSLQSVHREIMNLLRIKQKQEF